MKNMLQVSLNNLKLKTPLMTASGTSGHGNEIEVLENSPEIRSSLGAFVTKGVTLKAKEGNPEFRIVETDSGILNAIGLQNEGAEFFVKTELAGLLDFKLPVIVNISADSIEEFGVLSSYLCDNDIDQIISAIEINLSCPNIKKGGIAFGTDPAIVERIVNIVKKNVDDRISVITKLTPNITDITIPARAAINGGTDILAMINTLRGTAIDIYTARPLLGNKTGGLSGPAIKPVGLYMVYECFAKIPECKSRQIPVIGIGGISRWEDVIEYIMAGASAVGIGTAWFVNPDLFSDIYKGINEFVKKKDVTISELTGIAHQPCCIK
jgi:dihydroorotate dehydrogenase (NAD+) catalytic subunit